MEPFRIYIRIHHPIFLPSFRTKLFLIFNEGKSGTPEHMQALKSHGKPTTTWAVNDLMTSWLI